MKRIGNHGFTLLELLVVVIIIGVLASVAIPQFGRAIERARIAEANNILGAIATAEALYYQEQNGTAYTSSAGELLVDIPADASTLHFFTYSPSSAGQTPSPSPPRGKRARPRGRIRRVPGPTP
ncbi:MAG: prepilin-type N-terminal cleavage/methylation domain-containing protein [Candidatus Omnitrophica bacterium]|nr:prepilin-type N-terminal cleavage/methylation domain-containing protein [Candidatus Omnitrophota bacterium]